MSIDVKYVTGNKLNWTELNLEGKLTLLLQNKLSSMPSTYKIVTHTYKLTFKDYIYHKRKYNIHDYEHHKWSK